MYYLEYAYNSQKSVLVINVHKGVQVLESIGVGNRHTFGCDLEQAQELTSRCLHMYSWFSMFSMLNLLIFYLSIYYYLQIRPIDNAPVLVLWACAETCRH